MMRCEETTKELAKHWQCESEVQSVEDEETTRRRAARAAESNEASTGVGCDGCDWLPSFRHFCHLSCFAVREVRDCHSPFPVICTAFCDGVFLDQGQPVSFHSWDVIGVLSDEKGSSLRLSL